MYSGQQVRVLGENYTLEDEEDSKIGQVSDCVLVNFFGQFIVFVCWYHSSTTVVAQWGTFQTEAISGHIIMV